MNNSEGVLVHSMNRNRLAIEHPGGYDLTSGVQCSIFLAGQWIPGRVEYSTERGYFLVTTDQSIVGLCVGVRVQLNT